MGLEARVWVLDSQVLCWELICCSEHSVALSGEGGCVPGFGWVVMGNLCVGMFVGGRQIPLVTGVVVGMVS